MAGLIAWTKVAGQERFNRLSRRLRAAGRGDLQSRLVKAVKREGDPAVAATKAAFRGVDVTSSAGGSGKSTGLRARIAAATTVRATGTGIRVEVNSAKVDPRHGYALVFGLDALRGWSHPVFGNRNVWATQRGQEVFFSTLSGYEDRWRAGIVDAMEDAAREIAGLRRGRT